MRARFACSLPAMLFRCVAQLRSVRTRGHLKLADGGRRAYACALSLVQDDDICGRLKRDQVLLVILPQAKSMRGSADELSFSYEIKAASHRFPTRCTVFGKWLSDHGPTTGLKHDIKKVAVMSVSAVGA
eukprot:6202862-Pleurochrysis_carterae.AAC.3